MKKLKMHTPNMTDANIAKLAELFPNCVTESQVTNGKIALAIDFDLLKQELSNSIVEGPHERYQLNWPGKREALLTANAPIAKALRPCRDESVDFDTTKNLFIEGDNLDALKLLQETYLGKVKMIYIDPPYNTGSDLVYEDDFAENIEIYLQNSNQKDNSGNRLIANSESNGRFHSDWLSMMYSRLKLSRNLLNEEGVIFISIDDNEQANLKRMCDEVFGENNFIASFIVTRSEGGGLAKHAVVGHDYLLAYSKNISQFSPLKKPKDIRGQTTIVNNEEYWIEEDWLRKEFGKYGTCPYDEIETYHSIEKKEEIDAGLKSGIYRLIEKNGSTIVGRLRKISEDGSKFYTILKHLNKNGVADLEQLDLGKEFSYPKPISLIKSLILGATFLTRNSSEIILDFFAGSATTAHAVMQLNAEDGGNRKFILVQLPEVTDGESAAYKSGFRKISEISMERIRRAGKKIKSDMPNKENLNEVDVGFRVLKIDTSNMSEVFYNPDSMTQDLLSDQIDNVRVDRTTEDLLFQVMLDWGVDLTLPINRQSIMSKEVFFVDENAIVACFDHTGGVDEAFVKELAKHQPLRIVFRDKGFKDSAVKINIEQIFKLLSPATEVKCI